MDIGSFESINEVWLTKLEEEILQENLAELVRKWRKNFIPNINNSLTERNDEAFKKIPIYIPMVVRALLLIGFIEDGVSLMIGISAREKRKEPCACV